MRKFKKVMAISFALAMCTFVAACGGNNSNEATEEAVTESTDTETTETEETADEEAAKAEADLSSDGKVLNIYCFDDSLANRLTADYPEYQPDNTEYVTAGGKIGDIKVNYIIISEKDDAYQKKLDSVLPGNEDVDEDERVDIFMVEADYANKYTNTELSMPIIDLGISDSELLSQYKYTKDIVTDTNGIIKGVSWQARPGALIYNREAAREIIGSDDPQEVQEAVSDWEKYNETAYKAVEAGYKMTATAGDTFRVFLDNMQSPWVVDGQIVINENIRKWVDMTKEQVEAKICGTEELWSDDWSAGFNPDGRVFCYFATPWILNHKMAVDDPASIAANGGWGVTAGPQLFSWGGSWICAAAGTDNPALVADIMRKLSVDSDIMTDIFENDKEFVNNKTVMEDMAKDINYSDDILGGQNAYDIFSVCAENLDKTNVTAYDQGCADLFLAAMNDYFEGNTATYDEALEVFYKNVTKKYPELTY